MCTLKCICMNDDKLMTNLPTNAVYVMHTKAMIAMDKDIGNPVTASRASDGANKAVPIYSTLADQ